jgi:hypothetical protein
VDDLEMDLKINKIRGVFWNYPEHHITVSGPVARDHGCKNSGAYNAGKLPELVRKC